MINLEQIRNFFPAGLRDQASYQKYMLKEYLQLLILDFLSVTPYVTRIVLIGGSNLRLVYGIDRFSEDLDFDCKTLSREEFMEMTDSVLLFLQRSGLRVEARDRMNERLMALRRNIHFPEMLFDFGLTGHREERFLIKIESQDQQIPYDRKIVNIKGCGFYFPFSVPPDETLCSMKLSAMLSRNKGRDFYDAMFLLSQTRPDYAYLNAKQGINNMDELKTAVEDMLERVDLTKKKKDFEHLLFNKGNSDRILLTRDFFRELK